MHTGASLPDKEPRRRGTSSCRWSCTWRFFPRSWRRRTSHRRCRSSISPAEPSPSCPGPAWCLAPLLPRIPFPLQHRKLFHSKKTKKKHVLLISPAGRFDNVCQQLSDVTAWETCCIFQIFRYLKTRFHCLVEKFWKQQMTLSFRGYFRTSWKSPQGPAF